MAARKITSSTSNTSISGVMFMSALGRRSVGFMLDWTPVAFIRFVLSHGNCVARVLLEESGVDGFVKHFFAAVALVGLFSIAMPLNAEESITVSVWPAVAIARGSANLKVFVERNESNRS